MENVTFTTKGFVPNACARLEEIAEALSETARIGTTDIMREIAQAVAESNEGVVITTLEEAQAFYADCGKLLRTRWEAFATAHEAEKSYLRVYLNDAKGACVAYWAGVEGNGFTASGDPLPECTNLKELGKRGREWIASWDLSEPEPEEAPEEAPEDSAPALDVTGNLSAIIAMLNDLGTDEKRTKVEMRSIATEAAELLSRIVEAAK